MMDSEKLVSYIRSPFDLNDEDFKELEEVLTKYPYFQSANMLYVKAAHNIKTENFDKIVSKVSASVPNRELLHDLIMLTKKEASTEIIGKKEEESDTRKEIRERINQRKKIRILQKGEVLLESGKSWHQLIVNEFFTPMIQRFIDTPELIVQTSEARQKNAGQKSEFERNKEDREKRREERMLKREERFQQKQKDETADKQNVDNTVVEKEVTTELKEDDREKRRAERMLEREKRFQEKLKEKAEKQDSELKETIDISEHKVEEHTTPIEIKPESILVETEENKEELTENRLNEIPFEKIEENPITVEESKISNKKEKLIVEDIPAEISDNTTDHVAIEDIYDKIISSKKVDVDLKQPDTFIEIKEDIPPTLETKESESIQMNEDILIESDIKVDFQQSEKEKPIEFEVEEKSDTILEFIKEEKTTDIEINIDKETNNEHIDVKIEKQITESDSVFEFIEKKEEIELHDQEKESTDKYSGIEKDISIDIEETEHVDTGMSQDLKTEDAVKSTKAANNIFERIAAYKKKKDTHEEDIKLNKDELIEKFVNEQPSIKISESVQDESVDLSENSVKEKKPIETELMANIFINQGKFDQAIDIFEKLILKYPEKRDYFAAKIEELKNLKG